MKPLRELNGVLLLDKPVGMTSNAVLQKVKYLFRAKKAGHTGSLDPMASGMLPICFGEATKFAQFFLAEDKAYVTSATLGIKTDTGDADGTVIEEASVPEISSERLEEVLNEFRGDIQQVPPMYSALKHKGQRLYDLARKGIVVEREPRPIHIHTLNCSQFKPQLSSKQLTLNVLCSKGTYIRTLVEDIAEALGTVGHVEALYRTFVGHFDPQRMVSLEQLEQQANEGDLSGLERHLVPISDALTPWPKVSLNESSVYYFQQGQVITAPDLPKEGWVQVCNLAGELVGVGEINGPARVAPRKLLKYVPKQAVQ